MSNWEDTFASWAQGPAKTESEKCDNAETAIRKAIAAHEKLSEMDITIFAQGSYVNRTNIRQDSDVDICVRLNSTFFADYPEGKTRDDFGNTKGSISFADFKKLVGEALVDYFADGSVTRGNKAFEIHENTYRVNADVLAAMEYRRYVKSDSDEYHSGIGFIPDDKTAKIINWPEQNLSNGREKHENTGRRYKKVIRILKHLRNKMQEDKIAAAEGIASCLVEHLVWNAPDDRFNRDTLTKDVRAVLAHVFNNTMDDEKCKSWGEVNELKYLFRASQPWTREKAHTFISAAWDYLEFE